MSAKTVSKKIGSVERNGVDSQPGDWDLIGLVEQILAYIDRNPNARDTVEGISRWWVHQHTASVQIVLGALADEGIFEQRELGGAMYYGLHPDWQGIATVDVLKRFRRRFSRPMNGRP